MKPPSSAPRRVRNPAELTADEMVARQEQQWAEAVAAEATALDQARQLMAEAFAILADHRGAEMAHYRLVQLTEEYRPPREPDPRPKRRRMGPALRLEVYQRDHFRCVRCGTSEDLTLDHIVPESQGGATTVENLQCLCRLCNSSKGARDA